MNPVKIKIISLGLPGCLVAKASCSHCREYMFDS